MLTTFRRFLPTPKKKSPKPPDKTTENPHQTKSPAATPAPLGAAFSQLGAGFSRAGPGPRCRRPEQPRPGPAFPWRQRPRRRPRRLPPAAGRERPGPALKSPPPRGPLRRAGRESFGKSRDCRGKSLFFTPEDYASPGKGLWEGLSASVQPFPSQ